MDKFIISAIERKLLMSFVYEDLHRIVEPHCLGFSTRGNLCLRAYQVAGNSSTGILGWKLYDVSKIEDLELLEDSFLKPRDGYKKGDKQMNQILIEL